MTYPTYYDTCVFLSAANPAAPEAPSCRAFVNVPAISWPVVVSDVSNLDGSMIEFLDQFEVSCARYGVELTRVSLQEVNATQRRYLPLKYRLRRLGFEGKDWKHLMAAVYGDAQWLLTTDRDFWDPKCKATRGHPKDGVVRREILTHLGVTVDLPSRSCLRFQIRPLANDV